MNIRAILLEELNKFNSLPTNLIENVSVKTLNQFRTQTKSAVNYDLERDIEKNGIHEPVELIYHVHDSAIALSDGHHRLDIAIDLGFEKIPAIVIVSGTDAPSNAIQIQPIDWKGKEFLAPSELGIF